MRRRGKMEPKHGTTLPMCYLRRKRNGFRDSSCPKRMAYGVSLIARDGMLCIGGCDDKTNVDDVLLLQWDGKNLTQREMPKLPHPTSCAAGALVGSRVFVAGGQAGPNPMAGRSYSYFWSLDLDEKSLNWRELPTWPGPERFYAIAGSDVKSFFLFSGIRRTAGRRMVNPHWNTCATPTALTLRRKRGNDWQTCHIPTRRSRRPRRYVDGGLLLLGRGADGTGTNLPLEKRQPFGRETLRFDIATGRFIMIGSLPFGLAAVASANWHGSIIIASGEIAPGVRSPAVWSIRPESLTVRRNPIPTEMCQGCIKYSVK